MHAVLGSVLVAPFVVGAVVGVNGDRDRQGDKVFSFADPEIIESSGLVVRDDQFVTVNDSGDGARIFTVDDDGETVGHTTWDADPADTEALAPAARSTDVWVGDIGDNLGQRSSITITRVPAGEGDRSGALASYELVYPDGAHDAETLLVHPRTGQVFVAAKEFIGTLYAAPRQLSEGRNRLEPVGEVMSIATDGAFFPDGRHVVLRDYGSAAFYTWPGLDLVREIELPDQPQGEGIAVDEDGKVYVSSEGEHADVIEVELPDGLEDALEGEEPESREGGEEPEGDEEPDAAAASEGEARDDEPGIGVDPWWLGGAFFVVILVVLVRALRPR
ncbi:hypothetical protein HNR19_000438 [Nocardioides thalensis]|uniref:WD40 repeat domain-containing protein n=1 Tax=Nocardioides thalensis TaxID=1914755 RepID=A0A853BV51_9ACTN|nr:hypothetical protein [Nocardioides thalensis]NYI99739.1 hypothetical protein [Nocardioides thalensis]